MSNLPHSGNQVVILSETRKAPPNINRSRNMKDKAHSHFGLIRVWSSTRPARDDKQNRKTFKFKHLQKGNFPFANRIQRTDNITKKYMLLRLKASVKGIRSTAFIQSRINSPIVLHRPRSRGPPSLPLPSSRGTGIDSGSLHLPEAKNAALMVFTNSLKSSQSDQVSI